MQNYARMIVQVRTDQAKDANCNSASRIWLFAELVTFLGFQYEHCSCWTCQQPWLHKLLVIQIDLEMKHLVIGSVFFQPMSIVSILISGRLTVTKQDFWQMKNNDLRDKV